MAVPLIGGAARGTAAIGSRLGIGSAGGSAASRSLTGRLSSFLTSPTGAATGGFLAGDFLGASRGDSIVGGFLDGASDLLVPTNIILLAAVILGAYLLFSSDTIAFGSGGAPE